MSGRLAGKVAVVTGSGQGVGKGIAVVLAREGAKVVTNNRKPGSTGSTVLRKELESQFNAEEHARLSELSGDAATTANQIIKEGGEAVPFFGDVADFETAGRLIQTAVDEFGKIDILVNNAAGMWMGSIWEMPEADWDVATVPKLKGAFNTIRHASVFMKEQRWGRILNCTSDAWVGIGQLSAYSAANAGIVGLTKAVAQELYDFGITCNAYAPQAGSRSHVNFNALVRIMMEKQSTPRAIDKARIAEIEAAHGPAEQMAPFLAYLATDEAAHISGSVFSVRADGHIGIYTDPIEEKHIRKEAGVWTVDDLVEAVAEKLLKGYVSPALRNYLKMSE